MNTTENNKIIAEFMGYENIKGKNEHPLYKIPTLAYYDDRAEELIDTFSPYFDDMEFHLNWNWLMEVVEKIESLEYLNKKSTCEGFDSFGIEINKNRCDITHYGDFTHHLLQGNGKTRIESTYNACVGFIKWYSEANK